MSKNFVALLFPCPHRTVYISGQYALSYILFSFYKFDFFLAGQKLRVRCMSFCPIGPQTSLKKQATGAVRNGKKKFLTSQWFGE
jgi:hypothetical protein